MKRPLVYMLIFMILGVIVGRYAHSYMIAAGFALACFAVSGVMYIKLRYWPVFLFFMCFIIGFVLVNNSLYPKDENVQVYCDTNTPLEMTGTVKDIRYSSSGRQKVKINLKSVNDGNETITTDMNIQGLLKEGETVENGQEIVFQGTLEPLEPKRNPGGYDEFTYLRSRKIEYKTYPDILVKGDIDLSLGVRLDNVRNEIGKVFDLCFPPTEAGIMKSMIIGDTSDLDDDIAELYRLAGIYHILSISGSHISVIAVALYWVLGKLFSKRSYQGILTLVILILYCIMVGSSPATVRSVIMCGVIIIGEIIYRDRDLVVSISFAALCLLLYEPLYLFDVGFQYSFAAVYGIAICLEPIERGFDMARDRFGVAKRYFSDGFTRKYLSVSIAVTLATTPIMFLHFYYFLPYNIFVNMVVLPTLCITTVVGFIIGLVGLVFIDIAVFLSGIVYALLKLYEYVCVFFVSLPFSQILTGRTENYIIIGWFIALGFFIYFMGSKDEKRFTNGKRYFYVSSSVLIALTAVGHVLPKPMEIAMLDVGQGDCIVISKGADAVVIDGGGWKNREYGTNTGTNVLIPYLEYKGIETVDMAIASHTDEDHVAGVIELVGGYDVDKLYLPKTVMKDDPLYQLLVETANTTNTPTGYLKHGDSLSLGNMVFDCVYPFEDTVVDNNNDGSLVLKLNYGESSFMFTGDISESVERDILENDTITGGDLQADVLKMAHHGSGSSSTSEFLEAVGGKIAIVSAGKDNRYGHPNPEAVERVMQENMTLYNTADCGAIIMEVRDDEIILNTMINGE